MVIFWLPESLSEEQRQAMASEEQPRITLSAMIAALKRPLSGPLLTTRFIFGLAFSIFQTIFSLYALRRFNLDAQQTGFILAYVGLLSVIVQGGLIGVLTKRIPEDLLIILSVGIMAGSLLAWGFAPSVTALLIILAPTALAGGVLNTVISSALTKTVSRQEVGGLLGLSASLESLTRVIAPTLGGFLLGQFGAWSPGVFGAILLAGLFVYVWLAIYKRPAPQPVPANS